MQVLHSNSYKLSLLLGITLHKRQHFPVAERVHGHSYTLRCYPLEQLYCVFILYFWRLCVYRFMRFMCVIEDIYVQCFSLLLVLEFISSLVVASLFFKIDSTSNSQLAVLVLSVSFLLLIGSLYVDTKKSDFFPLVLHAENTFRLLRNQYLFENMPSYDLLKSLQFSL